MTIHPHFRAIFHLLWISVCAWALLLQTRLMFHLPTTPDWLDGFVFGSTVFGYHFSHRQRGYRMVAWMLGGLAGLCFLGLDHITQLLAFGPTLLWAAYYGLQRPGRLGLRRSPVAKPIVIALTWAWVTVWLPTEQLLCPFFIARAFFVFALALAYDLADLTYDQQRNFKTLVGQVGQERAYWFIYIALTVAALCVAVGFFQQNISFAVAIAIWATYGLTVVMLRCILESQVAIVWQKVMVDGMMVLQALAVWLAVW